MKAKQWLKPHMVIGGVGLALIVGLFIRELVISEGDMPVNIRDRMHLYLTEKAEKGDNEAMIELGLYYIRNGLYFAETVPSDYFDKGVGWLLRVKPPRDGEARFILGEAYRFRGGGYDDRKESARYYRQAIDMLSSQEGMGLREYYWLHMIHAGGIGTAVDSEKAEYYYDLYSQECVHIGQEPGGRWKLRGKDQPMPYRYLTGP